jgi:hypothetical protein
VGLVADRVRWTAMAADARSYASTVTLDAFQAAVVDMLARQWGLDFSAAGAGGPRMSS